MHVRRCFGANVHGYMLPGPYSTEHSLVDAQELARNLGIRAERVSIAEAYRVFESQLSNLCPSSIAQRRREHPGPMPHDCAHGACERSTGGPW